MSKEASVVCPYTAAMTLLFKHGIDYMEHSDLFDEQECVVSSHK